MNVDINKFNEIYPIFEKNVNTWVSYNAFNSFKEIRSISQRSRR